MPGPLIVLKFGGSVLLDERTLRLAVHEIYRWRRGGWRVVAVVSAFYGHTDQLIERARFASDGDLAPEHAVAALLATGESTSAALLALHLRRAGVPGELFTPSTAGLRASGAALDADPVGLDVAAFERALDEQGVVVMPGFIGLDECGRVVTLGRGGSDLTALHVAHALGGRCRLVKDVDGLYESDPAKADPKTGERPRRYQRISFDDALRTDGSIVQHKAVRYAQQRGLDFEVGRYAGTRPTLVSKAPSVLSRRDDRPRRVRVALLGLGTVGAGVYELLSQLEHRVEIVGVCVRAATKERGLVIPAGLLSDDLDAVASCGADIVIELIGGLTDAGRAVAGALRSGSHVVTGNKALLAERGGELEAIADAGGLVIRGSASVGGAMPIIECVTREGGARVVHVRGVLNGTTNFVLGCVAGGLPFDEAVRQAQQRGYAEADPSRDLSGLDAGDKLRVLARVCAGVDLADEDVVCESLTDGIKRASREGGVPRHVASLDLRDLSQVAARVRVEAVGENDALANVPGSWNAAEVVWSDGRRQVLRGRGAGRWPTAEAVVADVLDVIRHIETEAREADSAESEEAGVLAEVARV
ncbi:MAG: homoserine dehydrogenase [Leptolyngbya sp. PLA3]|nr:MAG: homoserine dehydrogenase [Cyanobacteria bacterium CYA]MCE7968402.1 homoserine dehydrogenase [Leptolyngbya sp. PL-A3]